MESTRLMISALQQGLSAGKVNGNFKVEDGLQTMSTFSIAVLSLQEQGANMDPPRFELGTFCDQVIDCWTEIITN